MKSPDPLRGVRLKLARAEEHLNVLREEVRVYTENRPYAVVLQKQPSLNELVALWPQLTAEQRASTAVSVEISEVRPVPESWSIVVGDFFHSLRSSLDHLARILVVANGQIPSDPPGYPSTQFPIKRKKPCYNNKTRLPQEALLHPRTTDAIEAALDRLQPYSPVTDVRRQKLSVIRDINDTDKHRFLNIVVSYIGRTQTVLTFADGAILTEAFGRAYRAVSGNWNQQRLEPNAHIGGFPLADVMEHLLHGPADVKVHSDIEVVASLHEVATLADPAMPLLDLTSDLLDFVRHDVVPTFEPLL